MTRVNPESAISEKNQHDLQSYSIHYTIHISICIADPHDAKRQRSLKHDELLSDRVMVSFLAAAAALIQKWLVTRGRPLPGRCGASGQLCY